MKLTKKNGQILSAILIVAFFALIYLALKMSVGKPWGAR
jgi:hypothetical protein